MDILFKGITLVTKEEITSDSILQGKKPKGKRIFLKHRDKFPQWIECDPLTVIQIK